MTNFKRLTLLAVTALLASSAAFAQGRKAVRINEVMVENIDNAVDDYGCRVGWIELFNGNFAAQDIRGMYLTNDAANPKLYPIPLGDSKTIIPRREHVVFWADSEPTRGTFHASFTLTPGQDNTIYLFDADGITMVDSVVVPASLPANVSYARTTDGADTWEVRDGSTSELYVTPGSANRIKDANNKVERFAQEDPHGFGLSLVAMGIVFCALLVLCLCFLVISRIGADVQRSRKREAQGITNPAPDAPRTHLDNGEEIAAITMALHQHLNAHDNESTILTINKVKRAYSPWSSKIYSLRETPRR
jgi:Na+-transporting methylmalonyl-CoA/oxaloacetate decarboxylase gamma subunit